MSVKNIYAQKFKNISAAKISEKLRKSCNRATLKLRSEILAKQLSPIDVVFEKDDLKNFEILAKKISNYKKIIVLGVGGSSLGGKTLTALRNQTKLEFLESIDPTTIQNCLEKIDFKNTFFVVISKSGETIETICQTLIVLDKMSEAKIKNIASQFYLSLNRKTIRLLKLLKKLAQKLRIIQKKSAVDILVSQSLGCCQHYFAVLTSKKFVTVHKK